MFLEYPEPVGSLILIFFLISLKAGTSGPLVVTKVGRLLDTRSDPSGYHGGS
jgi:hypothetical protein